MSKIFRIGMIWMIGLALAACQMVPPPSVGGSEPTATAPDLMSAAYAQATLISEQSQATAIVQSAYATANARVQQLSGASPTPLPASPTSAPAEDGQFAPTSSPTPVEVQGVVFGADMTLVVIQFKASPKIAQGWFQGSFSLTDEATGAVYDQVSVAPVLGPLINRPREEGKQGYAMLTNLDNRQQASLKGGELVTVTLGNYRFEHVPVQKPS